MVMVMMRVVMVVIMMVMIMIVGVIMVMVVMVMIVIMVMMIVVMIVMNMILLILYHRLQFLAAHLLLRDGGLGDDVVDDLLLEDRAAQLEQRIGVLAIVVEHLALLAGELAGAIYQSALQLVVGDGDAFLLAQRAEHEA